MKQQSSLTAVQLRKSEKELEKLAKTGLLTNEALAEFPYQLQRKWQDVARIETTGTAAVNTHTKILDSMIRQKDKLFPDGGKSPSGIALEAMMRSRYHAIIAEGETPENALAIVKGNLEALFNDPSFMTKDGFNIFPPKTKVASISKNHTQEMSNKCLYLQRYGK